MNAPRTIPTGSDVEFELSRFRSSHWLRLSFAAPLEQYFEESTRTERSKRLYRDALMMSAGFLLLLIRDYLQLGPDFHRALLVRCGMALPVLLLATEILRRNPPRWLRKMAITAGAVAVILSSVLLYHDSPPQVASGVQIGMVLTLLVTNLIMRVRMAFASFLTAFCITAEILFVYFNPQLNGAQALSFSFPIVAALVLVFLANYSMEREQRAAWLTHQRSHLQSRELARLNAELARLSSQDGLSGLANRTSFDQRLAALWNMAAKEKTPLSAVLVDIDHFKVTNDTFGHLYGDEVIRRVGSLLTQSLRGATDFAARYGGEEFVLLLPDTTYEAALAVAERVRSLVELAGSPPPPSHSSTTPTCTTVSCGVATVTPGQGTTSRDLLHRADTALYAAKADGRNCVRAFTSRRQKTSRT